MTERKVKCAICGEEFPIDKMVGEVCIDCVSSCKKDENLIDIH